MGTGQACSGNSVQSTARAMKGRTMTNYENSLRKLTLTTAVTALMAAPIAAQAQTAGVGADMADTATGADIAAGADSAISVDSDRNEHRHRGRPRGEGTARRKTQNPKVARHKRDDERPK